MVFRYEKQGIIAEATVAPRRLDDASVAPTLHDGMHLPLGIGQRCGADVISASVGAGHFG
jgi:hypothetical protein